MTADAISKLEDQIRTITLTKRIRPSEFFYDYDRLRSGYVTETQFSRVIWENLNLQLSAEQSKLLASKYDTKGDGRLNYRAFCEVINQPFNPNDLSDPNQRTVGAPEFLGTQRSLQLQAPDVEGKIEDLLLKLQSYYSVHGINLRTSCEDFDRHHIGVIQESQFYRCFPRPPEITEAEVEMLLQKYRDPDRPGLLNYLNLHHDLQALGERKQTIDKPPRSTMGPQGQGQISDFLLHPPGANTTVQQLMDRLRVAVFKNGIRSLEFFRDYDKLRSGIVTEPQFKAGLTLAAGKEAQLSQADIQTLAEFYRYDKDRIRYKEFTDMLENAFTVPDLEKKPTQTAVRPPVGALSRGLAALTPQQDSRLNEVLAEMREQVKERRLMMYQYFKDYDRSRAYSRVITPTQFGRILHFLTLNTAPEDFKLLCQKFADPATGDVNYPAFVQAVDHEFCSPDESGANGDWRDAPTQERSPIPEPAPITMDQLMARIRHHALTNRRRVIGFFQDYDPLRSGSITVSQFRRGLSDFGLSALGQHNLSNSQFQMLVRQYADPNAQDKVRWVDFMADVESVFTLPELEKAPTTQVMPPEAYIVPKPGTLKWNREQDTNPRDSDLELLLERLRQRVNQRRLLLKPVFQDFDKHNNGHVTRAQFRQCLTMLEMALSEAEMQALEAVYCDDTGLSYAAFLAEIQPPDAPKPMYVERLKELRVTNAARPPPPPAHTVGGDLECVLAKVKTKVFKERVRILEWLRDYDKLRSGRMIKGNFRRALDLCKFELAESELAILEDHYKCPGDPEYVEYTRFSDDIESIFTTKELEKMPLRFVEQFRPENTAQDPLVMTDEMKRSLDTCMNRIAEKVKQSRMQLFPLFEDYDRVHNGTVSASQFRRVLDELHLAGLLPTELDWVAISTAFAAVVGGKIDVDYTKFCDAVYAIAGFEWRKP